MAAQKDADMKAREYLQQLEVIETRIQSIQFDIQQLKDLAVSITPAYEGERVQAAGNHQRMAAAADRWMDKERQMYDEMDRLAKKRLEIADTIRNMKKPKESGVLHMLYIQGKSFKEIAQHYNKSVSWVTSIHGRALQSLQKELDAKKCDKIV